MEPLIFLQLKIVNNLGNLLILPIIQYAELIFDENIAFKKVIMMCIEYNGIIQYLLVLKCFKYPQAMNNIFKLQLKSLLKYN